MKIEMLMPQMGESITEGKILKWKKELGDYVEKDETILEISTDKVDSEIPAPSSGTIVEVLAKEGDTVPVKSKIAVIDASQSKGSSTKATPEIAATEAPVQVETKQVEDSSEKGGSDRFYSPLVKSLADKNGVSEAELATIKGSGQAGRVTKDDLLHFLESRHQSTTKGASSTASVSVKAPASSAPLLPSMEWDASGIKVVAMDNMRQAIADHMVRSKHTSPHVYSIQEIDVTPISKWRAKYKGEFQKQEGFSLSFTPFFLEGAVKGLLQFPYINAAIDGKKIILKRHINLGCAVALGNTGLIVPVIKRAEEKNLVGLTRALNELAQKARNKKLSPDDVTNGSFTVTNPGIFGTLIGTPIINQPQVAILCLGAITKRPVVINDMIAIREMCYLTLSYDHRIVDGSMAGQFLASIRTYLEGWDEEQSLS
jgi:2-oxoglutarate dehydrogenase E2 component (dihydrolipoamide succinyltransferase)